MPVLKFLLAYFASWGVSLAGATIGRPAQPKRIDIARRGNRLVGMIAKGAAICQAGGRTLTQCRGVVSMVSRFRHHGHCVLSTMKVGSGILRQGVSFAAT